MKTMQQQVRWWMKSLATFALILGLIAAILPVTPALAAGPDDAMPATDAKPDAKPDAKSDAKADSKADAPKDAEAKKKPKHDGPTRIAILNFGAPGYWKEDIENTVGKEIQAKYFAHVVPMLKKDKVDVVVIRVNSGGGALSECGKFHHVFDDLYKPNFRTVAWIESAISCAAMSPYVLDEMYFYPSGNLGACVGWYGPLKNVEGWQLEQVLLQMEKASEISHRSPAIMRAMQVQEPLSVDIDSHGNVIWRQDEKGQVVLNTRKHIFGFTAETAMKYKFANGIASNVDELAKAMGIREYVVAGQDATAYIDKSLRDITAAEGQFKVTYQEFARAYKIAKGLAGDKQRQGIEINKARRYLGELRRLYQTATFLGDEAGIENETWFSDRENDLRKMQRE